MIKMIKSPRVPSTSRTSTFRTSTFRASTFRTLAPGAVWVPTLLGGLLAAGCSGGGTDANEAAAGLFRLESTSITSGQTWQINRVIRFTFSHPVDFDTVNMNTLNIAQTSGAPAVGDFALAAGDPRTVVFQPTCPTETDFSDAGFVPGGVQYRIVIPSLSNGAGTIRSVGGKALTSGQTIEFFTPVSEVLTDLFLDPQAGPPTPITGFVDTDGSVQGTRLEFADGHADPIPFALDENGQGTLDGFLVPLNLYSDAATRFEVVVEINQPVSPSAANISQQRIQLQFESAPGEWTTFATRVELAANCTDTGAQVRLRPLGVLPQGRAMRVSLSPEFEDLVGDRNILALIDFALMEADAFREGGAAVDFADEFLEPFLLSGQQLGSFEDDQATFDTPTADWGELAPGVYGLQPSFDFDGTGGPGGDFDWYVQPNAIVILDTTSTLILGGPGGVPTTTQLVTNGVVNVRDLFIPASSSVRIQGPNPALFLCSGEVRIEGTLVCSGNNATPVFTLDTPYQPEAGASGNAGGGRGGTGSYLTNQVTPRGGPGAGAFDQAGAGGQGGESGWSPNTANYGQFRGAAGGGGGTLGLDVRLATGCLDQTMIGLDGENGFTGNPQANAAQRPGELMPWGGHKADRPFTDLHGTDDDFWGTRRMNFGTENESLVLGELIKPWPGSGGGAGGDATRATTYPPPNMVNQDQDKGCGGGGGAGSLTILALGDISLGPLGKIYAVGGHGSGGENTNYVNRIGGGSGGGAGGHVVLQTAKTIDLSEVPSGAAAVIARGGQGGAGFDNQGGADDNETNTSADAKHNGDDLIDNPFEEDVPAACHFGTEVVHSAGGDGGPGIIQFHVGTLPDDVIGPQGFSGRLRDAVRPAALGFDIGTNSNDAKWVDQLLPIFGRLSKAQSRWIPLGEVTIDPDDPDVPDPITFLFGGTVPSTGLVPDLDDDGVVDDLPPILAPAGDIGDPGLPSISPTNPRTLLLDASELAAEDVIYRRNPNLFRRFLIRVGAQGFNVEAGEYDAGTGELRLTVSSTGPELPSAGTVEVRPRYLTVSTNGIANALPGSSAILISFQATQPNALGDPDENNIFPDILTWATDVGDLNLAPNNTDFRFIRFRVEFDILADDSELSFNTPRPVVQFLRLPFRF